MRIMLLRTYTVGCKRWTVVIDTAAAKIMPVRVCTDLCRQTANDTTSRNGTVMPWQTGHYSMTAIACWWIGAGGLYTAAPSSITIMHAPWLCRIQASIGRAPVPLGLRHRVSVHRWKWRADMRRNALPAAREGSVDNASSTPRVGRRIVWCRGAITAPRACIDINIRLLGQ